MADASSSNDLNQILELMQKREREHAAEMQELCNAIEDLKENMAHGGANSRILPGPFQVRNVKLDFPGFDGSDVLQWIFIAEQFFDYYDTPDEHRLTITAIHFEKEVVSWYQMMQRNNPIVSWNTLVCLLELEFGPSPFESPRSTLFKLTQSTSVNEYYMHFTTLANRIYGVSSEALLDFFISGLKPDLRREVIAQAPNTILKAISLTRLFEEKDTFKPKPSQPHTSINAHQNTFPTTTQSYNNPPQEPILPTLNQRPFPQTLRPNNIKRLSPAEMQSRREKKVVLYMR
ncbi:hypothetical protein V8G54_027068 [Vigna mungo]|uniref:Retrotransposon gag domain-containing protein n=1 Tax=Vigna mungo TaxID=3915 RepID=A0AAQ3RMQ4_VIGMU